MPHKICKISNFKIVPPYTLELYFDDSVIKVVDLEPILYGELYGRLRNIEFFKTVFLDSEVHTIVWPNGADFDPAILYNREENLPALLERISHWRNVAS